MKKIFVSDITPRVSDEVLKKAYSFREKLDIVSRIERSGADALELPALTGSREDAVIYRTAATSVENGIICIPGGDSAEAIDAAWECIKDAANPCIQIILPVSTVQMEYIYHIKAPKMLEKIAELCKKAGELCSKVEFVAQDATRAEAGFAAAACKTAAENGAYAVTLCDDNGDYFPEEWAALVKEVKAQCGALVYIQPSDKLNMAAAGAVEAIKAGADGIKTSAVGKQYLSADTLAEIIRAKGDMLGIKTGLDVTAIHNILSDISSAVEIKAAQAAENADGKVSLDASSTLTDVVSAVSALGYELSDEDNGKIFEELKRFIARKDVIGDKELEAIIASTAMQVPSTYHVISYVINSGSIITATANITLEKNGERISGVTTGDGPIDAAFRAIEQIIGHHYELDDFQVQAVTKGREAVGSALVRLRADGRLYSGNGASTDVVGASIRAYINALNKIVYEGN